jgi:hypothetical protein
MSDAAYSTMVPNEIQRNVLVIVMSQIFVAAIAAKTRAPWTRTTAAVRFRKVKNPISANSINY